MEHVGTIIVYILMICAVLGMIGAIKDEENGIGFEFMEGVRQVGVLFIPIAGVMASLPYIHKFVETCFTGISDLIGCDAAVWAGILLPPDMGGNILAKEMADSYETWIIALFIAFILGSGVTFGIPTSIFMVKKRDHKYLSLGIMCGIMACPVGIAICCFATMAFDPAIRAEVSTTMEPSVYLTLTAGTILINLLPVFVICALITLGIWRFPEKMIKGFMVFGRALNIAILIVFTASVVEYFTGFFSMVWSGWGFDPILADDVDFNRALEIGGFVAMMLAGAYPMMYLVEKYLGKHIAKVANKVGITSTGSMGIIASSVTLVAMFRAFEKMPPKDKVRSAAWALCGGYFIADHLTYCYQFQPELYAGLALGKIIGGILAMVFVGIFTIKTIEKLEAQDRAEGIIGETEYLEVEAEVADYYAKKAEKRNK